MSATDIGTRLLTAPCSGRDEDMPAIERGHPGLQLPKHPPIALDGIFEASAPRQSPLKLGCERRADLRNLECGITQYCRLHPHHRRACEGLQANPPTCVTG